MVSVNDLFEWLARRPPACETCGSTVAYVPLTSDVFAIVCAECDRLADVSEPTVRGVYDARTATTEEERHAGHAVPIEGCRLCVRPRSMIAGVAVGGCQCEDCSSWRRARA